MPPRQERGRDRFLRAREFQRAAASVWSQRRRRPCLSRPADQANHGRRYSPIPVIISNTAQETKLWADTAGPITDEESYATAIKKLFGAASSTVFSRFIQRMPIRCREMRLPSSPQTR